MLGRTNTSLTPTVIPALEEYLNPKSFILSNIIDVSVMWNLLNISEIIFDKKPFLNGVTGSFSSIYPFKPLSVSSDGATKYLSGVAVSKFSLVGSFKYGNPSGRISLKITLPIVVISNFLFCSSVNVGFSNDLAIIPTRVCKWIYPF